MAWANAMRPVSGRSRGVTTPIFISAPWVRRSGEGVLGRQLDELPGRELGPVLLEAYSQREEHLSRGQGVSKGLVGRVNAQSEAFGRLFDVGFVPGPTGCPAGSSQERRRVDDGGLPTSAREAQRLAQEGALHPRRMCDQHAPVELSHDVVGR